MTGHMVLNRETYDAIRLLVFLAYECSGDHKPNADELYELRNAACRLGYTTRQAVPEEG